MNEIFINKWLLNSTECSPVISQGRWMIFSLNYICTKEA